MKFKKAKERRDSECIAVCLKVFYFFKKKYQSVDDALLPAIKIYRLYYPNLNHQEAEERVLGVVLKEIQKII